ncbi:calcium-binding protein [Aliigemmobacter aestuarii]|uniref:Calcium-binding protein n=1 Tax=Aliigemmobacter aestuarii TaxID=1445661 RepID=A0A4V3V0M1_9RHOB|nr:calcium-binding protein [Gemmobacter aestuarii]THD84462.1 calcium-binding protein [Gemmobacter aestuarii]
MPVSIPGEIPGDTTTTAIINPTVNDTYESTLGTNGDADWWRISLTAGLTYDFTLTGNGGPNSLDDGILEILTATGTRVSGSGGAYYGSILGSITSATGGTFHVQVRDGANFDNLAEGDYIITARTDDTVVNNATTTAQITGSGITSGALGQSHDSDWYRVTLTEGLSYGFTLVGDGSANTLDLASLTIRSATGTRLDSTNEEGTASWTALSTGTYFIDVSDRILYDFLAEGNFRIIAAMSDSVRNDAETGAGMIDGQRIGGQIDVHGDGDWYGFNAVAGRTYTVRLTGNGAANDLEYKTIRIFDSSGRQIASDRDTREGGVATVTFTASVSGRIYLSAEGSDYAQSNTRETGGFFLQITSDAVVVNGTGANEHLTGVEVNNRISGLGGNDSVYGANGNDLVMGGTGNDLVDGGEGNDTLRGEAGNDTLSGGAGIDTADYSGSAPVRVNLSVTSAQNTGQGIDRIFGVENVQGGSRNDAITGNGGANLLIGGGGNDTLKGGAGNDRLQGDAGNDLMLGGTGKDWAVFTGSAAVTVNLGLTGAQNTGWGRDTIREIENVLSGAGRDTLTGSRAANILDGGAGNDRLSGAGGNDTLIGGTGRDNLRGDGGRDALNGGTGNDTLTGGAGADRFEFNRGTDADTVTDFRNNTDTLAFGGFGFFSVDQVLALASQRNGNVIFDLGGGDRVVVLNSTINALADDIVLI